MEIYIVGLIMSEPAKYLHEVCQEVLNHVSPSTICQMRQVALQSCEQLQGSFMAQCFLFRRDMFLAQMLDLTS